MATIPIKTAARKLPVKRKTPETPLTTNHNPNPNPPIVPKTETLEYDDEDLVDEYEEEEDQDADEDLKPPPFKYHRIWTEPDEIRFLQGLLDSFSDGFVFPRDLNIFFDRFSNSMSQPYTKSQLSEKLRRLRKKFRVLSARLARGLDSSLLTPHDRSLFHLSKQLWHPSFAASSPFSANVKKKPSRARARVSFSPPPPSEAVPISSLPPAVSLPPAPPAPPAPTLHDDNNLNEGNVNEGYFGLNFEESPPIAGGLGKQYARTVMDVFDGCLKEVRAVLIRRGLLYPDQNLASSSVSAHGRGSDLTKRWREQRVAELDVLARRLRLVLEHAIQQ